MIPEIGQIALAIALTTAAMLAASPLAARSPAAPAWAAVATRAAVLQFALVAAAFGCLAWSFVAYDFSVANVADNAHSRLPLAYRFAATWGSHEGSLLLWLLMLSGWTAAAALLDRASLPRFRLRALGTLGMVNAGFGAFLLFTSNPFARLFPPAAEGRDLNPLLQDPAMVIHPPLLYMGYVGFAVAFAYAVAALLEPQPDAGWARRARPWTLAAWCFLTLGIGLGSYWAYYELGWGGWWFWDPTENASLMPWLAGTALIHSLAVTARSGALARWSMLLAVVAFALSLLGTFLIRSGVLSSVHAFANDPQRGLFILGLLALAVGVPLALYSRRGSRAAPAHGFMPVSREALLLANNALLLVAAAAVLLGTLYPLVLDALGLGKLSVGAPYFDAVFAPLMAPALFLMGAGPVARWRADAAPRLAGRLRWALAVSVVAALAAMVLGGGLRPLVGLGVFLAVWIAAGALVALRARERLSARVLGMAVAHVGLAVTVMGITLVRGFETELEVRMAPGATLAAAGHEFRFVGAERAEGPNYAAQRASIEVARAGETIAVLHPEKRVYIASGAVMTEAAIRRRPTGDLYVSLGEPLEDGAWAVRVYVKPFVAWIWGGALLMAGGGALAAFGLRRSRQPEYPATSPLVRDPAR
ncbi:MAG TPA: heme lyase CcmF/NrfE family subunit [Pelomicrobium sp.]|nr:heme lyase CcmF/NrfE family subunit [Pelomicrobium sp.]